jgi:hypothetical protein
MDLIACLVTFFCSILIGMEFGILIGVGLSIFVLLLKSLKPPLNPELLTDPIAGFQYLYTKPTAGLAFPSVDHVRTSVMKLTRKHPDIYIIVVSFEKWTTYDYTVVTALASLVKTLQKDNRSLIFVDCEEMWIDALKLGGLSDVPCIPSMHDLPNYLNKSVLLPASSIKNASGKGSKDKINLNDYGAVVVGGNCVKIDVTQPVDESGPCSDAKSLEGSKPLL